MHSHARERADGGSRTDIVPVVEAVWLAAASKRRRELAVAGARRALATLDR